MKADKPEDKAKRANEPADKASEDHSSSPDLQGEGNYDAARRYNEGLRRHVRGADIDQEARDAAPTDPSEARDLERAEREGRSHSKEEDPLLDDPDRIDRDQEDTDKEDRK